MFKNNVLERSEAALQQSDSPQLVWSEADARSGQEQVTARAPLRQKDPVAAPDASQARQ